MRKNSINGSRHIVLLVIMGRCCLAALCSNKAGNNISLHIELKDTKVADKICSEKETNGRDPPSIAPCVVYISVMILLIVIMIKCWLWDLLDPINCCQELFRPFGKANPKPPRKAAPKKRERKGKTSN